MSFVCMMVGYRDGGRDGALFARKMHPEWFSLLVAILGICSKCIRVMVVACLFWEWEGGGIQHMQMHMHSV